MACLVKKHCTQLQKHVPLAIKAEIHQNLVKGINYIFQIVHILEYHNKTRIKLFRLLILTVINSEIGIN